MEPEPRITQVHYNLKRGILILKRDAGALWERYDVYRPESQIDIVRELVRVLDLQDPSFADRFVQLHVGGVAKPRYRYYVAADPKKLGDVGMTRVGGIWIANDWPSPDSRLITEACKAAGIPCGSLPNQEGLRLGW